MRRIAMSLALAPVLFGCVASYVPPGEPDSPTVAIDTTYVNAMFLYEDASNCSKPKRLPDKYNPFKQGATPIPVAPHKEVAFRLIAGSVVLPIVTSCGAIVSFVPQANTDYLLKYGSNETTCFVTLLSRQRSAPGGYAEDKSLKTRNVKYAVSADGPFCDPLR
jgi:hypothetical protein